MTNPLDKPVFAFYLSDLRHFDYFNNVFIELTAKSVQFCLVLNDTLHSVDPKFSEEYSTRMQQKAETLGYPWFTLTNLIHLDKKIEFSISTFTFRYKLRAKKLSTHEKLLAKIHGVIKKYYPGGLESSFAKGIVDKLESINQTKLEYPEEIISIKKIFFPKGMDLNTDKFPDQVLLDNIDYFFCHGFIDKELIDRKVDKPTSIIGYPRYDNFWKLQNSDLDEIRAEFGIDRTRKVVTWIPTYGPSEGDLDHNIHVWLPYVKQLTTDFDVIIRPHPKRINSSSTTLINELKENGLLVDLNIDRDMSKLYKLSDCVLCDSGGVVFSAIYTLSNVLILNEATPDFSGYPTPYLVHNVKSQLPGVVLTDLQNGNIDLVNLISDSEFWSAHRRKIEDVRRDYFGDTLRGNGSRALVDALVKLESEING